jgi:hypothetical protein
MQPTLFIVQPVNGNPARVVAHVHGRQRGSVRESENTQCLLAIRSLCSSSDPGSLNLQVSVSYIVQGLGSLVGRTCSLL